MAVSLRVPDSHLEVFAALAELDDDSLGRLVEALDVAEPTISGVTSAFMGTSIDPSMCVQAAISFASWRSSQGYDLRTSIEEFENSVEGGTPMQRIEPVLGARSVSVLGRAMELSTAHERVLHGARVVSDIRPVFGDVVSAPPIGASVSHDLILRIFRNDRVEDLHVALDATDLRTLLDVVQRAREKESQLLELARKTGLAVVDWAEVEK